MHANFDRIDSWGFDFDVYLDKYPERWKAPENWDQNWKIRLRMNHDGDGNVLERMVSIHDEQDRLLMFEFQSKGNPKDLVETYPSSVNNSVFQCEIAVSESLRGKSLALPFWIMSELILIKTDSNKQRLILDISGSGWTERRMPEYYSTLKTFFPKLSKLYEYNQDGVYFVIYDFGDQVNYSI